MEEIWIDCEIVGSGCPCSYTVEAGKLEHDHPPTANRRKKEHQHKSSQLSSSLEPTVLVTQKPSSRGKRCYILVEAFAQLPSDSTFASFKLSETRSCEQMYRKAAGKLDTSFYSGDFVCSVHVEFIMFFHKLLCNSGIGGPLLRFSLGRYLIEA